MAKERSEEIERTTRPRNPSIDHGSPAIQNGKAEPIDYLNSKKKV